MSKFFAWQVNYRFLKNYTELFHFLHFLLQSLKMAKKLSEVKLWQKEQKGEQQQSRDIF